HGDPADLRRWRAPAARRTAADALDRLEPFLHFFALLLGREAQDPGMAVAMMGKLVPALEKLLHQRLALIDDQARHEEGGFDAIAIQQIEHPAGANLPAISALRHQDRAFGIGRIARRPHRLGVQIESKKEREAPAGQWHCKSLSD